MGFSEGAAGMVTIMETEIVRAFCCIRLDNGTRWWIRREDLPLSGFQEGLSYEEDAFHQQVRLCQYPRALNHAVSMLARRPCSKKEIVDRLKRLRYTDEVAGLVIFKLAKENLVDDAAFCDQWIRHRLSMKYGPSVIRRELRIKGIPPDMIEKAFEVFTPDEEAANALKLAVKAWKRIGSAGDIRKNRQKVIAFLVRKGYGWDAARLACEKAETESE